MNDQALHVRHPGLILGHEIKARGWTQKHLAHLIKRPEQCVSEVVRGKKRITPRLAIELGEVLGTSAEYWWHLEAAYELQEERDEMKRASATAKEE